MPTFENGSLPRWLASSQISTSLTTQVIVTAPSHTLTLSQSGVTTRNCLGRQLPGAAKPLLLLLGLVLGWLETPELATAHCYGNCWRPQQPPPQGGGERAGVLRNSKTKHRTVKAAKNHCCPELNFAGSTNVCLFGRREPRLFHKSHKSDRWRSCCLAARLREPRLCSFQPK